MMKGLSIEYEMKRAGRTAMMVPGQIRETEAAFLYKLARRKGNLVEIGCLFGRSTVALVMASQAYKAEVTSIDPFIETANTNLLSSPKVWQKNLTGLGLEVPKLMKMISHDAAKQYSDEIAFLFIDGGHSYETVKQDIEDWLPKIKVTGVVAFHDMFTPHITGVARAVTEWWLSIYDRKNPTWKIEGMVDHTIAFRRFA
jgi:predicted O-methyltransferase YrrM